MPPTEPSATGPLVAAEIAWKTFPGWIARTRMSLSRATLHSAATGEALNLWF